MKESERIAALLSSARYQAEKTQEYMAEKMNKSTRTIGNWELGKSVPTIIETIEWFRVLGMNPLPSLIAIVRPEAFWNLNNQNMDDEVSDALMEIFETLSTKEKRALIYMLAGKHGSSPYGVLQVGNAYLHLPFHIRYVMANMLLESYLVERERGNLVNIENIMPDIEELENLIHKARAALAEGKNGYVDFGGE